MGQHQAPARRRSAAPERGESIGCSRARAWLFTAAARDRSATCSTTRGGPPPAGLQGARPGRPVREPPGRGRIGLATSARLCQGGGQRRRPQGRPVSGRRGRQLLRRGRAITTSGRASPARLIAAANSSGAGHAVAGQAVRNRTAAGRSTTPVRFQADSSHNPRPFALVPQQGGLCY